MKYFKRFVFKKKVVREESTFFNIGWFPGTLSIDLKTFS